MKKYFAIFCICIFAACSLYAGKIKSSEVPKAVVDAITKAYPKAKIGGYEKEKNGGADCIEVELTNDNKKMEAVYSMSGVLIQTEVDIKMAEVPEVVQKNIMKEFPKAKMIDAEKISKGNETLYEVEIKDGGKTFEVIYTSAGKFVEKKVD